MRAEKIFEQIIDSILTASMTEVEVLGTTLIEPSLKPINEIIHDHP